MSKSIIIPHDVGNPLARTDLGSLLDFQAAVGGYVQSVAMPDVDAVMFCDEDGKGKDLPVNHRATALWWLFESSARGRDVLVGDVAFVGAPDSLGETADVPEYLSELLIDAKGFKVQVAAEGGLWLDTVSSFDDFFHATMIAMRILAQTSYTANVRVILA